MNRKKKIIELHKKKWKKTDKRLQNSKKEKYVSKADRAKLALEAENAPDLKTSNNDTAEK